MSDTPAPPPVLPDTPDTFTYRPLQTWDPVPPRRRFQARLWVHVTLLLVTFATTTFVGALHYASFDFGAGRPVDVASAAFYLRGLWYSLGVLSILGAHEMGHYLMCRRYNTDASLPYFMPMLLPTFLVPFQIGTLGAVIRIREPFANRKVLFDIGIAGPIAGFAVLIPLLFIGLRLSSVMPIPTEGLIVNIGEPLLFKGAARLVFGSLQVNQTLNVHPLVLAAWFGMLATALNLLPFGQLDGGHITYAAAERFATPISLGTVTFAVAMTLRSPSWVLMTAMMLVMLWVLGPRHPRVLNEYEQLGTGRRALAVFALVMLVLCFIPAPLDFVFLKH